MFSFSNPSWITAQMATLPLLILIAGFSPYQMEALAAGIALPLLHFLWRRGGHAGLRDVALGSEDTVLDLLAHGLSSTTREHDVACICFGIDNLDDLVARHGAFDAEAAIETLLANFRSTLRGKDRIARLECGDYAIALPQIRKPELGPLIALVDRLQRQIPTHAVELQISFGFCCAAQASARTAKSVLQGARDAHAQARRAGPNGVRGYAASAVTDETSTETLSFAESLASPAVVKSALNNEEITAYYQPQICTDTGKIAGFEALARWTDGRGEVLPPKRFLLTIKHVGKLEALSEAMLNQALKALRSWDHAGFDIPHVAVNFATDELRNPHLMERIKWDLDRFDLAPNRLTVELLETVVAHTDDDVIARNIRALSDHGVRIDLDDFGTGHASLANIARFDVDRIKIDRSFIAEIEHNDTARRMISAMTALADQLGVQTVAEGVETAAQRSLVSQLGCAVLQGYAVAHPMPRANTLQWIASHDAGLAEVAIFPRKHG